MKKIAILGGAFDPPHQDHLRMAEFVLSKGIVDWVFLTPCFQHIFGKSMADARYRISMLNLLLVGSAFKNIAVFEYEVENKLPGDTYSFIKSLLKNKNYKKFEFSYVIGQDNADNFQKWTKHQELIEMIPFIVIPRKGIVPNESTWYKKEPHLYLAGETGIEDISSTKIRTLIKEGKEEEAHQYINGPILNKIKKLKLYKE